mgnify:CR=1 FL=1|jgi:hypothetical protein
MTLQELKERVAATGYLPKWLKDGVAAIAPARAVIVEVDRVPSDPKWCPYGMSAISSVKEDGTIKSSNTQARNRRTYLKEVDGVVEVAGVSLSGSLCVRDRCQMWDGVTQDCGLKNPLLHVRTFVEQAKALADTLGIDDGN